MDSEAPVVRVIVADDSRHILAAMVETIARAPGMTVVGTAADADEALDLAEREQPDVAVLDVRMPRGGGQRVAREMARVSPRTRIVVLSAHDDRASVSEMIRAGALSYVVKGGPVDEIVEAVERASRGLSSLSGDAAASVRRDLEEQLGRRERREEEGRRRLERVRAALEPGAIVPVFQPIVDLVSTRVVGYEALSRFQLEPRRGPDAWLAEAAEVGLQEELEYAAIRLATDRFDDLPAGAYLSLNLSPSSCLSQRLEQALLGLPAERVVIEVTENAPVPDYQALRAGLQPLKAIGGRLAIDDAGAGFAGLRHIVRLAPDIIKLDVALTRDIDTDRARRAMAAALVSFAGEMGIVIVAEGIETQAEFDTLRSLGVRYGQGYFLGRPDELPAASR